MQLLLRREVYRDSSFSGYCDSSVSYCCGCGISDYCDFCIIDYCGSIRLLVIISSFVVIVVLTGLIQGE